MLFIGKIEDGSAKMIDVNSMAKSLMRADGFNVKYHICSISKILFSTMEKYIVAAFLLCGRKSLGGVLDWNNAFVHVISFRLGFHICHPLLLFCARNALWEKLWAKMVALCDP